MIDDLNYQTVHEDNMRTVTRKPYMSRLAVDNLHSFESENAKEMYARERCLIVKSKIMGRIVEFAARVSRAECPVLIQGEFGVGKESIAHLLHNLNPKRRNYPIVKVNCGAIPQELIENEFLGCEPGAFPGDNRSGKPGYFELADKGTILLNEINELPLSFQAKLLRILQYRVITRSGGVKPISIDVRFIATTKRDLKTMVKENSFREDLYYHINAIPIQIPPLRERTDEIPHLLFHYLNIYNKKHDLRISLSNDVVECLTRYDWPGNVSELVNLIERLVVIADTPKVNMENLPQKYRIDYNNKMSRPDKMNLKVAIEEVERSLVKRALQLHKSTYKAAKALGVSQSTIVRKAKKYKLNKVVHEI